MKVEDDKEFTIGEWMTAEDFTETLVFDLRSDEEVKVRKQFACKSFFKTQIDVCDEKP